MTMFQIAQWAAVLASLLLFAAVVGTTANAVPGTGAIGGAAPQNCTPHQDSHSLLTCGSDCWLEKDWGAVACPSPPSYATRVNVRHKRQSYPLGHVSAFGT